MQNKTFLGEFGNAVMQIAEEKGIARDKIIGVVEAALAAAYKKEYGQRAQNIRATFDEKSGDVKFFLVKEVVDETVRDFTEREDGEDAAESTASTSTADSSSEDDTPRLPRFNPERDITVEEALAEKPDAAVGDEIIFPLPTKTEFGRVAAQTAKQVVIQRVREAERDMMFAEYKGREHDVISATVQRVEGRTVFVDLGKAVGVLFPSEQIRNERYSIGMRLKVYILDVSQDPRGPGITVSRSHPDLVRRLFELEVPEIFAGTVEIKALAREAGSRTKMAVYTEDDAIDPIGSCVGQRGTRVQAVIDELGGEKIDVIEWDDDPVEFITAALSPAKVLTVTVDEENRSAVVVVPDDQLSLAIGRRGQNVRLAVKLTNWHIDVISATAAQSDEEGETTTAAEESDSTHEDGENTESTEGATENAASDQEVTEDVSAESVEDANTPETTKEEPVTH